MKFIHCADLHLESKMDGIPSEKSKIRREEVLRTFERLCDYAEKNGVAAIIIAGDMFDTSKVTTKTRDRVLMAIKNTPDVDFLYLSGNHDEYNFISEAEQLPNNLKSFGEQWTQFNYENVCISGVKITKNNVSVVYDQLRLDSQKFNIVTLHGQLVNYTSDDPDAVSLLSLKNKNVDYLALGHVHSFSEGDIDERGKYVYSGCLEGRGFDEIGSKGFVLVEVNGKDAEYEFINFATRSLVEIEYDLSVDNDWIESRNNIIKTLSSLNRNSLIKIKIKGEHGANFSVDKEGLAMRLNEEFFFVKVEDKSQLKVSADDYALDKSVRGEFIRSVWESALSQKEKSSVIMCGINALNGEEI